MKTSKVASIATNDRLTSMAAASLPIAVNAIVTPLIARQLGPSTYGVWVTLLAAVATLQLLDFGVFSSVFTFMTHAVARQGPRGVDNYIQSVNALYATVAIAIGILLAVGTGPVHEYVLRIGGTTDILTCLMVALMFYVTPSSYCSVFALQAQGRYLTTLSLTAIGQILYVAVIASASLWHQLTLQVVIASFIAARLVPMIPPLAATLGRSGLSPPGIGRLGEFFRFSRGVWLSNISAAIVLQLPFLVLNGHAAPELVGIYGAASVVATSMKNIPVFSLPPIIRQLTGSQVDIAARGRSADRRWIRWIAAYWLLGVPIITVGFPIAFGSQYAGGTTACLLLFTGYAILLSTALATQTTRQLGQSGTESVANLMGAAIFAVILISLVDSFGIAAPGIALIVSQIPVAIGQRLYFLRRVRKTCDLSDRGTARKDSRFE